MSEKAARNTKAGIIGAIGGAWIAFTSYWLTQMGGEITAIKEPEHINAIFAYVLTNVFGVGGYSAYYNNKPNHEQLKRELIRDESRTPVVYLDSLGNKTVGVGSLITPDEPEHALEVGDRIPEARVDELFKVDLADAIDDAHALFPDFADFPPIAQRVIANMAFQMGRERLSKFTKTRELINQRRWKEASVEMLNSRWAHQTPERAVRLSEMMKTIT